ncbi:MAG: helix-turn-helix transcriptional regulator [Lachnospiraceae bacterium]|nr:helix-turn-helix transcriptional regulator [Lachnospiraceae bacterium]
MNYPYESIVPNRDLPFKMFLFEGANGNYYREKHWHREIEIFSVFTGGLEFVLEKGDIALSAGQIIVVNSNEVHAIRAPIPNHTLVIQIPLDLFSDYLSPAGMISFHHRVPACDAEANQITDRLNRVYEAHDYGYELMARGLCYEFLYLLVTRYRIENISSALVHQYRNLDRLSRITDYMQQNFTKDLTLEHVSGVFNYAPTYLAHMFRSYAGTTFKAYLQHVRLEHAKRDMDSTDKPLGEIALDNGFASSKAFAHVFRQQYGILPSQYKRQL